MDNELISRCWYQDVCTSYMNNCKSSCIRYVEMKYLMENSLIPVNRQFPKALEAGIDYNAYVRLNDIKSNIIEFVNNGESVYIYSSETGNGKTSWSIKLLLKYFDTIWAGNGFRIRGLFLSVPTLLSRLKNFNDESNDELKSLIPNVDLVVWDDIASTVLSQFDLTQLMVLIDQRILNGKSNIYTGNLSSKESLEKNLGSRLASRIWQGSQLVEFKGKDRRHGSITNN